MKYCNKTTLNHSLCAKYPSCLEELNEIFKAEGYKSTLFANEVALNIDKVERECSKKKKSPESTMDLTIGISREGKQPQMLLVELKFNSKNPHNISKRELDDKIRRSIDLLSDAATSVAEEKIILFNDNKVQVGRRVIYRLYGQLSRIKTSSGKEFKEKYF